MSNVKETKKRFLEQIFNEVDNVSYYCSFYLTIFNIIAKLRLYNKEKKEKLFETGDWTNEEQREELIKKVKQFLIKHIK